MERIKIVLCIVFILKTIAIYATRECAYHAVIYQDRLSQAEAINLINIIVERLQKAKKDSDLWEITIYRGLYDVTLLIDFVPQWLDFMEKNKEMQNYLIERFPKQMSKIQKLNDQYTQVSWSDKFEFLNALANKDECENFFKRLESLAEHKLPYFQRMHKFFTSPTESQKFAESYAQCSVEMAQRFDALDEDHRVSNIVQVLTRAPICSITVRKI